MSDPGCFFHGEEPVPDEYFRLCVECGHCFLTEDEFTAAAAESPIARPDPQLPFCPLCSHDF